ncbi:hypothetical protein KY335_00860 [Candidatus Woesearchaeota archaeon]|nr:hypothetical protein [Candidatus Woesearchaeota archaeon]
MAVSWYYIQNVFGPQVANRVVDLVQAPWINPDMVWIVTPLLVTLLLMTFYFGKYKREELGWNTAVGNSLVLIFVSIDLMRYLYHSPLPPALDNYFTQPLKTTIAVIIFAEGIFLVFSNFLHWWPKKVAFFVSSPLPVNLTAYVAIAIVYTNVVFNWVTLVAAVILFFILLLIFTLLKTGESRLLESIAKAKVAEQAEEISKQKQQLREKRAEIEKKAKEVKEIEEQKKKEEAQEKKLLAQKKEESQKLKKKLKKIIPSSKKK